MARTITAADDDMLINRRVLICDRDRKWMPTIVRRDGVSSIRYRRGDEIRVERNRNRIYYEPRCHEGNNGMNTMLLGARMEDQAFAEGRGPDPAAKCYIVCLPRQEEGPQQ